MKHVFIENPKSGMRNAAAAISEQVACYASSHSGLEYEEYVTQSVGDATRYVRNWCERHPFEEVRFYACGGDGTLNEVVSGMVGRPLSQVAAVAVGSGNDYVKYHGSVEDFRDVARLIEGSPTKVDLMKIGDRYSINVCNFGFDAEVCRNSALVRNWPLLGGRNAYTTAILKSLSLRHHYIQMKVDGADFYDDYLLLCTLSNGKYVGGKYLCAPLSQCDDGKMEVGLFRCMPLLRLIPLIPYYMNGTHLQNKRIQGLIKYCRASKVVVSSTNPFWLCIDGEMVYGDYFEIENLQRAINFVLPKK